MYSTCLDVANAVCDNVAPLTSIQCAFPTWRGDYRLHRRCYVNAHWLQFCNPNYPSQSACLTRAVIGGTRALKRELKALQLETMQTRTTSR